MTLPDHYPGNEALPLEVGNFFSRLQLDASRVANVVNDGWQRSRAYSSTLSQEALYHAAILGESCADALHGEGESPALERLRVTGVADLPVRYEVEAAMRLIPAILPFDGSEIERLEARRFRHWEQWADSKIQEEPGLVARWHRWLWKAREGGDSEDRSDASLLTLACSRLAIGLQGVLGQH
jgi:hypothetical protein